MTPDEQALALWEHFTHRRVENREGCEPESIKLFCVLSKGQFVEWAREFFEKLLDNNSDPC